MADIHSTNSNYVRYILFSEISNPLIIDEPIGWREDEIELLRNKDYHGIFFSFTGGLKFTGEAKDYIKDSYDVLGVNAKLLLVKQKLRKVGNEVKFVDDYSAFADFLTMVVGEVDLTVNFNSYDIAEILASHQDDDFEMETTTDIDGNTIQQPPIFTTTLKGRSLSNSNEGILYPGRGYGFGYWEPWDDRDYARYEDVNGFTPLTKLISESGTGRTSSVDAFKCHDIADLTAGHMFFTAVDDTQQDLTSDVTVSFRMVWKCLSSFWNGSIYLPFTVRVRLQKYKWDQNTDEYTVIEDLYSKDVLAYKDSIQVNENDVEIKTTCLWDEALGLRLSVSGTSTPSYEVDELSIIVQEDSFFEQTQDAQFMYTHDVGRQLAYIMTGDKDAFYSKFFGRIGTDQNYVKDGTAGRIANISGLWARGFKPGSDLYKSIQTNFKSWFNSSKATWNIGLGVDNVSNKERLRVEELKYFYQNKAVIRLPNQITNVVRKVDASLFYSGIKMGYKQGGDYSNTMGLDEPNTESNWITAIRKSTLKYEQTSDIRADDYGLEETRRKPQYAFPDEDSQRDEVLWWLDMVFKDGEWQQAIWSDDRLEELPQRIYDPGTFYGMRFTPQQMLFRHGWVIRAGLEKYTDKEIIYGSSKANNKLVMQFIGEKKYQANDNIFVSDLERSRLLPEIIEFDHPVSDEIMDMVMGYTEIEYEGAKEFIRNFYFKVEFLNEFGVLEKGYIKSLKPNGSGKWVVQKSNEELLGEPGVPKEVKAFNVNTDTNACDLGASTFPTTLYFEADENEFYPALGKVIYTDEELFDVAISISVEMENGLGLVTSESGVSIEFTCE